MAQLERHPFRRSSEPEQLVGMPSRIYARMVVSVMSPYVGIDVSMAMLDVAACTAAPAYSGRSIAGEFTSVGAVYGSIAIQYRLGGVWQYCHTVPLGGCMAVLPYSASWGGAALPTEADCGETAQSSPGNTAPYSQPLRRGTSPHLHKSLEFQDSC